MENSFSSVSNSQLTINNAGIVELNSDISINHSHSNTKFTSTSLFTNNVNNDVFSVDYCIKHNGIYCCFDCVLSCYDMSIISLSNQADVDLSDITLSLDRLKINNDPYNTDNNDNDESPPKCSNIEANLDKNNTSYLGNRVVNLSNYQLNKAQISLLEKGITFAPTPGDADIAEIHLEVNRFIRRILLKLHFYDEDNDNNDNQLWKQQIPPGLLKFKTPSTWTPRTRDPNVLAFIDNVQKSIGNVKTQCRESHNLTKEERENLELLRKNGNIVIKKADKGSSIVVMNKSDYVKEAQRQLSDPKFYKEIPNDLTTEHQLQINTLIEKLSANNSISEPISLCLKNTNPKTSSLYLLPKIHKIKQRGEFPAGRPIISANGSPTERISAFVDENIKGAVPLLPSFIKDTTDFIYKIENIIIPDNCLLVSFDVTSLYTNIPNDEGIKAVARSMTKHKPPYCPPQGVILLLREVLTKNNFTFNGNHYLQVGGTAMGTKLAPSYANIFMGDLEKKLLEGYRLEPIMWLRFIDDIFALWTHGLDELYLFLDYMNDFHPSIKFTMEFSDERLVFLDTIVKKAAYSNTLLVELYTKPTDTHNYLHFNSFHPGHTKRGGPFGQFLRIRRNCTLITDYDKHSEYIKEKYIQRGYPASLIEGSRARARSYNRAKLLDPNRKKDTPKNDNVLPLVLTYHPSNVVVKEIITNNWGLLKYSELCKAALPEKPLFATRRNTNLKDILIKSRLDPFSQPQVTGRIIQNYWDPCTLKNCSVCPTLKTMKSFMSEQNKRQYKRPPGVQCRTANVIYLLTCNICKKQYVGETKRPFVVRLKEHLADIRLKRDKPLAIHMNSHNSNSIKVIPQIIEVINRDPELPETTNLRKKREIFWIYRLRTLIPHGLNKLG